MTHVHWESSSHSGSGRKLFIATERNLVASLNIHDGSIGKCTTLQVPVLHDCLWWVYHLCILSDLVKLLLCDCNCEWSFVLIWLILCFALALVAVTVLVVICVNFTFCLLLLLQHKWLFVFILLFLCCCHYNTSGDLCLFYFLSAKVLLPSQHEWWFGLLLLILLNVCCCHYSTGGDLG